MQRRTFVKNAAIVGAGIMLSKDASACFGKKKAGIQLYSVRDEVSSRGLEASLEKLASIGFRQIEMYGYNDGKYFGNDMKAVAGMLKKYGLTAPSSHVMVMPFITDKNDDSWRKAVDDAATIGNKYIAIPWLPDNLRKNADDWKYLAERLNRAAEITNGRGLKFAYHNHDFEFAKVGNETGYDILLKNTNPATVKMELDLFWTIFAGVDPIALFKGSPGRYTMWHIKDMDRNDPTKQTELGAGSIDYKEIFKFKKLAGLEYPFLEQEQYNFPPFDSVEKGYQYLRKNLI